MTLATSYPGLVEAPLEGLSTDGFDTKAKTPADGLRTERPFRKYVRRIAGPLLELIWVSSVVSVSVIALGGLMMAISGGYLLPNRSLGTGVLNRQLIFRAESPAGQFLDEGWSLEGNGGVLVGDSGSMELPAAALTGTRNLHIDLNAEINHPAVAHGLALDLLINGKPAHRWDIRWNGWNTLEADINRPTAFQAGERTLLTFVLSTNQDRTIQAPIGRTLTMPRLRISAR